MWYANGQPLKVLDKDEKTGYFLVEFFVLGGLLSAIGIFFSKSRITAPPQTKLRRSMLNPFTAQAKVSKIQQDVLRPLYTMYSGQETAKFDWLLVETGRAISRHQPYIEEVCSSRIVAVIFKIIKLLGGADQLTEDDFDRFTEYVRDGGIKAMVKMLLSANKEKTFTDELKGLPPHIQQNAPVMLAKSRSLHADFVNGFFKETHGSMANTPQKLQENFSKSDDFIARLVLLAAANIHKSS